MGGLLMDETFVATVEGLLWGSSYGGSSYG